MELCLSCGCHLSVSGDHQPIYAPTRDPELEPLQVIGNIHKICPRYRFSKQTREILNALVISKRSEEALYACGIKVKQYGLAIDDLPIRSVKVLIGRELAYRSGDRVRVSLVVDAYPEIYR